MTRVYAAPAAAVPAFRMLNLSKEYAATCCATVAMVGWTNGWACALPKHTASSSRRKTSLVGTAFHNPPATTLLRGGVGAGGSAGAEGSAGAGVSKVAGGQGAGMAPSDPMVPHSPPSTPSPPFTNWVPN